MDSSSGVSSLSSELHHSEEDTQQEVMDSRKRKRMISNRESARRSRLRKQKHLEELMAQVAELRRQNHQTLSSLRATTQHCVTVESENSVLRAQAAELTHRLQWLAEVVGLLSGCNDGGGNCFPPDDGAAGFAGGAWNCLNQMAAGFSADSRLLY